MKEVRAIPGPGPGWIGQGSRARQASPRRRIHRHTGEDREGDVLESILSFGCRTDRRLPSRRATSPFDRRALLFASHHITSHPRYTVYMGIPDLHVTSCNRERGPPRTKAVDLIPGASSSSSSRRRRCPRHS
jgi:hypothetical protein